MRANIGRARNETGKTRRSSSAAVYTAEIVADMSALERVEAFHRAHHAHPASHFDLLRAAFLSGKSAPFFVQVACNGEPCLLMAGQLVRGRLRWRLGYGIALASRARTIEVRRGGWLGDLSSPGLEFLCEYLAGFLRRGGADAVHLRDVPFGSSVHKVFGAASPWLARPQSGAEHELAVASAAFVRRLAARPAPARTRGHEAL